MIRPPLVVGVGKPFKMNAVYSGSPTWSIDLGDGSSPTTNINASFSYPAEGVYTIRVTGNGVLSTAVIRVIYDEKHFPLELSSLNKSDTFATVVATAPMSGYEQRRRKRTFTRARFNAGLGVKSIDEANILRDFFLSCYGRYKSFYITDYFDYRFSKEQTSVVTNDALTFQIVKRYTEFGGQGFTRNIRNLKNVTVYINDVLVDDEDYTVNLAAGQVTLSGKVSTESVISFEGEFVKLCRFDTDEYDHQLMQFVLGVEEGLMQPPSVPILELIQNNFAFVLVTGLSADVLSASEITWSWDSADDPDVVGYEISLDGGSWTDVGDVLIYEGTGFDADTEYGLRVRAYDAAGNRSAASAEVSATTDAYTISPTPASITVPYDAAFQFNVISPISGAVWTLEGDGTLDQSGNYTAPAHGGTARIRYHSPMWQSLTSYMTLLDDDRIQVNSDGPHYWQGAKTNGKLTEVGDWVEFVNPVYGIYEFDVASGAGEFLYYGGGVNGNLGELVPPASTINHTVPWPDVGDVVRFEFTASRRLRYLRNGVEEAVTTNAYTQDLSFFISLPMPLDTVIEVPRFGGSGITGYTEYIVDITII